MTNKFFFFLLLCSATLIACNNTNDAADASAPVTETVSKPKSVTHACDLLSEKEFRDYFQIDAGTAIETERKGQSFPACNYKWGENVYEGTVKAGGKVITYPASAEVMIVMAKAMESDFEKSTSIYEHPVPVEGLGKKAVWDDQKSQLTVFHDGRLLHFNVRVSADPAENKAQATGLSKVVLGNL